MKKKENIIPIIRGWAKEETVEITLRYTETS